MRTSKVFAGRHAELAEVEAALSRALTRHARTVLIAGEPGIGKTMLVEELAARAERRGCEVVWSQSSEIGGVPPFWPWIQVVRALLSDAGIADRLDPSARSVIASLAGDRARPTVDLGSLTASEQARFELFDAATRLLRAAADARPLVVVLEDVHTADVASLHLLRFAATHLRDTRALFVVTYREHELAAREDAAPLLAQLPADAVRMSLQGLSAEELAVLVESLAEAPVPFTAVETLHDRTAGNPFYTESLVRVLVHEGRLASISDDDDRPLPAGVVEVIGARISRLPDDVQALLRLLAVAGRTIDRRLANRLAEDHAQAGYALELAHKDRLIEAYGEQTARFRFVHALVPAALVSAMPLDARERAHAEVAFALIELHGEDAPEILAELADHFARAGEAYAREAFRFARAAAQRALDVLAYEDAAAAFERAGELGDGAGASEDDRVDVLLSAGLSRLRAGQIERGQALAERAWEIGRRMGSPTWMARAALVYGALGTSGGLVDETLVRMIGGALADLGDSDGALRARLRARLAHELSLTMPEDALEVMATEAVEEARVAADPAVLAMTLQSAIAAMASPQHTERTLGWCTEMIDIARSIDDRWTLGEAFARRSVFQLVLGRRDAFAADVSAMRQIAAERPSPVHRWYVDVSKACEALTHGDFDRARELIDATLRFAEEVPNALGSWQFQRFVLTWETGGIEESEAVLNAFLQIRPGLGPMARAALALIYTETGREDEARAGLVPLAEEVASRRLPWIWLIAACWASDVAVALSDKTAARILRDALTPFADLHMLGPTGTVAAYWGSVRRQLGNLKWVLGELDEAIADAERALSEHIRMRAPTFVARSRYELARALLSRAHGDDVVRALALLHEADTAAHRMGMTRLAAAIARLDRPAVAATPPPGAGPTATLEGEYWTITHAGVVTRLKDSKGLRYLLALLANPDRQLAALELVTGPSRAGVAAEELRSGLAAGDPILDQRARSEYERRIRELEADLAEAEQDADRGRVERIRDERDFLLAELQRTLGLGGRARTLGSTPSEQARVAVTKGIRSVLRKIEGADPALGRHLRATVRTGTFCAYTGEIEPTLRWAVRP